MEDLSVSTCPHFRTIRDKFLVFILYYDLFHLIFIFFLQTFAKNVHIRLSPLIVGETIVGWCEFQLFSFKLNLKQDVANLLQQLFHLVHYPTNSHVNKPYTVIRDCWVSRLNDELLTSTNSGLHFSRSSYLIPQPTTLCTTISWFGDNAQDILYAIRYLHKALSSFFNQ